MSKNLVKVGLVQMSCSPSPADNLAKATMFIRKAAEQGANIVSLQELFNTLYFCQTEDYAPFDFAEPIPGETTHALSALAKELGVVIVAPMFEKRAQGIYHNSAAVIDADGAYLGKYRKMHIPDDPGFYEKFYFTPGDLGFKAFKTKYATIGVLICWDQWYPEAARLTALKGAQILFYPTAIGWATMEKDPSVRAAQRDAWETIQRGHAVANGAFVAVANRVGTEHAPRSNEGLEFWGHSFVANPFGVTLAKASSDKEEILIAECDLAQIDFYRQHWPFLRDRRIDAYHDLAKRYLDET
ncbi:MAG: carbon-nitrogen hydrolase [Chloroherpetonaceae bacterium]|nr:carbon-nitrogen hydrolase [Chloroherpetonaceae bacterium]MDW8438212.1 carbon-nitrogen hydrolase [Chloroherpetonaceae bacterium]